MANSSAISTLLKRRIDAFEAVHVRFAEQYRCTGGVIARFNRPIPFHRLKEGVRLVEKKHFLLRCGISLHPLTFVETENVAEVSMIEKIDDEDWQSLASIEVHKPFNYREGPLLRLSYLVGKDFNELVLSVSHSIGDGHSAVSLLFEICEYVFHGKSPKIEEGWRGADISVERVVLDQLNDLKRRGEQREGAALYGQMWGGVGAEDTPNTRFVYRSLDRGAFHPFFREKREGGYSFQALLSAIFIKEYVHFRGTMEGLHYTCPINIRPFMGGGGAPMGCKISLLELFLDRIHSLSYDDLASFISVKMCDLLRNRGSLLQNIFNLFSTDRMQHSDLIRLGVSNMGRICLSEDFGANGLCSIYVNGTLGNKFTFHPLVCALEDQIHATFCFSSKFWTDAEAQTFSDHIVGVVGGL